MEKTQQQAFEEYVNVLWELLHSNCPVDTGNMKHHIRIEKNDGMECIIVIDTIPYTKSQRKKTKKWKHSEQEEYASKTEYGWEKGFNPNEGWIRNNSILNAAQIVADGVENKL